MSILALLGVLDEVELLPHAMEHLRRIGVDRIIALDAGSTDGDEHVRPTHSDAGSTNGDEHATANSHQHAPADSDSHSANLYLALYGDATAHIHADG